MKYRFKNQKGQIALVVLLTTIVMLTLGISVAQRGLFDVATSQLEEDTSRAFQAAETGVEIGLSTLSGSEGPQDLGGGVSYDVTVAQGGSSGLVSAQRVKVGEELVIDLTNASLSSVDIFFIDRATEDCDSNPAALEMTVINSGGSASVDRSVFDVDAAARGNNFTPLTRGNYLFEGKTFCARADNVNVVNAAQEIRLRPVYSDTTIGIFPEGGGTLGDQFSLVRSEGVSGDGVTRAVEVQRGNPALPSIFDYVLFSGGGLVK